MTTTPPTPDPQLCEQLCAWMDGELPAEEARFLQRRLEHDADLRGQWERLQLASSCLKGQPFQPMSRELSGRIGAAVLATPAAPARSGFRAWAIAASVAAVAVLAWPLLKPMSVPTPSPATFAVSGTAVPHLPINPVPTPASADLVAAAPAAIAVGQREARPATVKSHDPLASLSTTRTDQESPLPLTAQQSPADFPLVESAMSKRWPRSPVTSEANDPSLEAYLVRHNQMVSDDGLGGFVPYVDVVAKDGKSDASTDAATDSDPEGNQ